MNRFAIALYILCILFASTCFAAPSIIQRTLGNSVVPLVKDVDSIIIIA